MRNAFVFYVAIEASEGVAPEASLVVRCLVLSVWMTLTLIERAKAIATGRR